MKFVYQLLSVVLVLAFVLWMASKLLFSDEARAPQVIDYDPVDFIPTLSKPHFFELNGSLAYSSKLIVETPLFEDGFSDVIVSPNGLLAVVVTKSDLWVVSGDGNLKQRIGNTRSILDKSTELGFQYFMNDSIQWSDDSRYLYLLSDQWQKPVKSLYHLEKRDLFKYEIESDELTMLVSPLKTSEFFLYKKSQLFYFSDEENGDRHLFKHTNGQAHSIESVVEASSIDVSNACNVFFNFTNAMYHTSLQAQEGFLLERSEPDSEIWVISQHQRELLRIREGLTFKGSWHGINPGRSSFPKDEKYVLIDVYSESFEGVLLADTETDSYMELGQTAHIYQNNNTCNTNGWRITDTGIENW